MAALLEEETVAYPELRRGEIIEGVVVGTDRDGILVDIGAKSEGVVPPNEMHCLQPEGASKLSNGDKVLVFVLQPESPEGQIILSLDRARGERGWRVLQDYMDANQGFEGYVTGSNKGGLLVNVEGVNAFVPLSQIVAGPERGSPEQTQRALTEWVGKNITLKVIELNRRRNRAILSERAAVQERRAAEKERLLLELNEGDIKTGRITSIRDFGIFVDIGGADGLVHLSELSWDRAPRTPQDLFKVGDEIAVYVLKVDNETKKIALSVRRAQPERWEEIVSRYREGQIVAGQVTKLAPFGAFVKLEGPIEGLIHISELVDRRINHPKEVLDEGDVVPVKIVRIEYDRHRLGLSLRQAKEKAEEDGWSFSDSGRTLTAPADVLESFGVTEATSSPPDYASADGEVAEEAAAVEVAAEIVSANGVAAAEELATDEATLEVAAEVVAEEGAIVQAAAEEEPAVKTAIQSAMEDAEAVAAAEELVAGDEAALEVAAEAVAVEEAVVEPAVEAVAAEEAIVEGAAEEVAAEAEAELEEAVVEAVADEEPIVDEAPDEVAAEVDAEVEEAVVEAVADEEPIVEEAPDEVAAEADADAEGAEEAPEEVTQHEVTDSSSDVTEESPDALNNVEKS